MQKKSRKKGAKAADPGVWIHVTLQKKRIRDNSFKAQKLGNILNISHSSEGAKQKEKNGGKNARKENRRMDVMHF